MRSKLATAQHVQCLLHTHSGYAAPSLCQRQTACSAGRSLAPQTVWGVCGHPARSCAGCSRLAAAAGGQQLEHSAYTSPHSLLGPAPSVRPSGAFVAILLEVVHAACAWQLQLAAGSLHTLQQAGCTACPSQHQKHGSSFRLYTTSCGHPADQSACCLLLAAACGRQPAQLASTSNKSSLSGS